MNTTPPPALWIVIPCYNEAEVLPSTAPLFLAKLQSLIESQVVSPESRICFVDDGSRDETWSFVTRLSAESPLVVGLALSRNRGHQNALLCGLMEARSFCDVSISIDCDGQDDIDAIDDMLARFSQGNEIVYGVRSARDTDTPFKRKTAESFYRFMQKMGTEVVFNHADFRLMGKTALEGLSQFGEKNLFLRGIVPLIGFQSTTVEYERSDRVPAKATTPSPKWLISPSMELPPYPLSPFTSFQRRVLFSDVSALSALFGLSPPLHLATVFPVGRAH